MGEYKGVKWTEKVTATCLPKQHVLALLNFREGWGAEWGGPMGLTRGGVTEIPYKKQFNSRSIPYPVPRDWAQSWDKGGMADWE